MSANMIRLVTLAIARQLGQALTDAGINPANVHVGAIDEENATDAALILFLYRLAPSAALRNEGHVVFDPANPDRPITYANALPLDLGYLLTVGRVDGSGSGEPLHVLGVALQRLSERPLLSGSAIEGETVRISIEGAASDEMSRAWALFPTANYRTSVLIMASPVWIDPSSPPETAEPAVAPELAVGQ